jgi:hypothetical protein
MTRVKTYGFVLEKFRAWNYPEPSSEAVESDYGGKRGREFVDWINEPVQPPLA